MREYDKLTSSYKEELIENLKKFISINSVLDESTVSKENPFGIGVTNALKFVEDLARKDGFIVNNYNNMIVEILCGTGEKNITILAHADVVPAATGWDQDPFELVEKDGVLYARGVADDKGPALAAYYGLKALRDNNLLGNYQVRFLVGGNEETGSKGVEYYFNELKKPQPTLGFSPDSNYPLIYGEKSICNFKIEFDLQSNDIKSFKGGVASNSVIELFEVELRNDEQLLKYKDKIKCEKIDNKWVFKGKAAHGSVPWEGENAALYAIQKLAVIYDIPELKKLYNCLGDPRGKGMNADFHSEDMGTSSCNLGIIEYDGNKVTAIINFRFVDTVSEETIVKNITEALKPFKVTLLGVSPLLFYPLDSVLVSTLLSVYREETGDLVTPPQTTGGGTYAKEADNVIAFGMEFPGWDSKMHSPGECTKKEHLFKSMSIYARAIVGLGKKLNEN